MIGALRRATTIFLAAVLLALAGCGGSSKSSSSNTSPSAGSTQASTGSGCRQVAAPQPRKPPHEKKPTAPLDSSKRWSLTFKTNCGDFTVALNLRTAPKAAASMVSLARANYFDDTVFHRIAPGFVIQGGDPSASGSGGPGYKTVDTPPQSARYTHGAVAMAKTETEKPGTAGSQFFVVTGADAGLPPDYALLGRVTNGLAVVDRIGQLGDQSEQPTEPVVISDVVVSQG